MNITNVDNTITDCPENMENAMLVFLMLGRGNTMTLILPISNYYSK